VRVLIFGASGATGRELVARSLALGMEVSAFVRDPAGIGTTPGDLRIVVGELDDADRVAASIASQDAVVSALGVGRPLHSDPAVVDGIGRIVEAMERSRVRRFVYLSFAGVHQSRRRAGLLIRHAVWRVLRHEIADHERKEELIARSGLDWTIVRAPKLTDGPPTGAYRSGEEITAGTLLPRLSRADVAEFMLRQLTDATFIRKAPSLFP
jgi:putative NADH-flavin reductase